MNIRLSKNSSIAVNITYMAFIAFMSLKPYTHAAPPSTLREFVHNSLHVPAYAIMALLCYLCLRHFNFSHKIAVRNAFITAFLYGALLEVLQGLSPGRSPSFIDLCSNAFGAGVMLWVVGQKKIRELLGLELNPDTRR